MTIALYQNCLHLQDATFTRIEHEEAMVATVYKVTQHKGEPLILKIHERPNDYFREVYFLTHLTGNLPIPQILQTVEPKNDIHGAILMPCLPGTLLSPHQLTDSLAYEVGRSLALIHQNRLAGYGDPMQGDLSNHPLPYFTLKFKEGLTECKGNLPAAILEKCSRYYESNRSLLASVDGPCVVHRDFRPGNLMVHEGKLQGVIDWAGARASFAEEDFCSIEHGKWLSRPSIKASFLSGYERIRPLPLYDPLIPFLRLNKAIATLGFTVKRGIWTSTGSRLYQLNYHFLETFLRDYE